MSITSRTLHCLLVNEISRLFHKSRWMNIGYTHHFWDFNRLNNPENFEETWREPVVSNRTATHETMLPVVAPTPIQSPKCRLTLLINGSHPFKMMFLTTGVSVFTGYPLSFGNILVAYVTLLLGVVGKVRLREGKVFGG